MSGKILVAAVLLAALVPVWLAALITDLSKRMLAILAVAIALLAAGWWFAGPAGAAVVLVGAAVLLAAVGLLSAARRFSLSENANPTQSDVLNWCRRAMRRQGWNVRRRSNPPLLVADRKGFSTLTVYAVADWRRLTRREMQAFAQYTNKKLATVVVVFHGAPKEVFEVAREFKLFVISHEQLLPLLAAAKSDASLRAAYASATPHYARFDERYRSLLSA
jgi:hypothetical protein